MQRKEDKLFKLERRKRWEGIFFQPYAYLGRDGRKVISWILHLGRIRLIKYRYAV